MATIGTRRTVLQNQPVNPASRKRARNFTLDSNSGTQQKGRSRKDEVRRS
jgi:hypothetical protein